MNYVKFNQLLDTFSEKIDRFEELFDKFQNYTNYIFSELSQTKLSILKNLVSEWFVCYLSIYDEFFSLYVGNIWLPRHMSERSMYEHVRKGRDHADAYKGVWTSKCSMDGIVYEVTRLNIEDERIENRVSHFTSKMDSFPSQFQRVVQEINTKLRGICKKETIKVCFDHQVEKIEFRLEKGNTLLSYHIQRKSVINSINIENLNSYFLLTNQRKNPTKFKRKRIIEEDDEDDNNTYEDNNNNQHLQLEKVIIDIAIKCSKNSRFETINKQKMNTSNDSTNISLDAIKRQYGVDPTLMRAHHEAHENETKFNDPKKAYVNIIDNYHNNQTLSSFVNVNSIQQKNHPNLEQFKANKLNSKDEINIHNFSQKQSQLVEDDSLETSFPSKSSISWTEKNKVCFENWVKQQSDVSVTSSIFSPHREYSINISVFYQIFDSSVSSTSDISIDNISLVNANRCYEIKLNWETLFSDNFSSHLSQLNRKNSYIVSISTLLEEIYLNLLSDDIFVFPFQLIIYNSKSQTEIFYNIGKNCQLEELIHSDNVIQIKCYQEKKIYLFLYEIFELRKEKQLHFSPPFLFLFEIINYLHNVLNVSDSLIDLSPSTKDLILLLQSSLSYPSQIFLEWFELIYPIILKYIPSTIPFQLSLRDILITKSFFIKLLFTSSKLTLISCYSNISLSSSSSSSSSSSKSFIEELHNYMIENSLINPKLSELHLISCSNLFIFKYNYNHLYDLLTILTNNFEDFKILNLKNSINLFHNLNIFHLFKDEDCDSHNNNNNNNNNNNHNNDSHNNSYNNNNQNNNLQDILNEFYLIFSKYNERNIIKCIQIDGMINNLGILDKNISYYINRFELLNNLTIIISLDD